MVLALELPSQGLMGHHTESSPLSNAALVVQHDPDHLLRTHGWSMGCLTLRDNSTDAVRKCSATAVPRTGSESRLSKPGVQNRSCSEVSVPLPRSDRFLKWSQTPQEDLDAELLFSLSSPGVVLSLGSPGLH